MMNLKSAGKRSLLAIDDKIENLKVLIRYLENSGFELMVAQSGEEAFKYIDRIIPDIILLDVLMPGLDGYETCRQLKQNETTRDIPVIFMTALTETVSKVKGFEVGAADYLTKPLQHEEVLARVKAHMMIKEFQQQLQEQNILLQQKNQQLIEANAIKDKFFSIIAHDLKNPLNTLLTYCAALLNNFDRLETKNIKQGIETVNKCVTRAYDLLIDLLMWALSHAGKIDFKSEKIDLGDLARENVELLRERATQKGIRISSEINDNISIHSDKNMVSTVLRNLLSNAVKFTSKDGEVKVRCKREAGFIEITVSDTGIGISRENIKKLFRLDTFYRTLGSDNEKGTGLGLILCKEFVDRLKGRIWVESEPGKGSHFVFTFPDKIS